MIKFQTNCDSTGIVNRPTMKSWLTVTRYVCLGIACDVPQIIAPFSVDMPFTDSPVNTLFTGKVDTRCHLSCRARMIGGAIFPTTALKPLQGMFPANLFGLRPAVDRKAELSCSKFRSKLMLSWILRRLRKLLLPRMSFFTEAGGLQPNGCSPSASIIQPPNPRFRNGARISRHPIKIRN